MINKIRLHCIECGVVTMLNFKDAEYRSTGAGNILCPNCCAKFNWKSPMCLKCSENIICSQKFGKKFKEWLEDQKGH